MSIESMVVGLSLPHAQADANQHLHLARQDGFDYVTTALPVNASHPRADVCTLESKWWRTSVVGSTVSPSVSNSNSNSSPMVVVGAHQIKSQLEWAWHQSLPAVILPPLSCIHQSVTVGGGPSSSSSSSSKSLSTSLTLAQYATAIQCQVLKASNYACQVWVPVRLTVQDIQLFQQLQALVDYAPALQVMVVLDAATPSQQQQLHHQPTHQAVTDLQLLHVLTGSAVISSVSVSCSAFLTNKRGFPTLSKHVQILLQHGILQRIGGSVRWLLQGPAMHALAQEPPEQRGVTGCLPYLQYLQHLRQRPAVRQCLDTAEAILEREYLDHLQRPLQPLKDHLENSTYEVFEKDPVKYQQYETAVKMALQDRRHKSEITVTVVGAGRGPLVSCAIRAWLQLPPTERPVVLYVFAIEKNPSAVIYLRSLAAHNEVWKAAGVQVVQADLRYITRETLGGRQADIVVSELLGSFGCNELSPECLDGLFSTNVCGNETISIPVRYTSHLAPLSSIKLFSQARQRALFPDDKLGTDTVSGYQQCTETAYVVRPHAASQMCPEQDCWDFVHPPNQADKNRSAEVNFVPDPTYGVAYGNGYGAYEPDLITACTEPVSWTLTGFIGTFTAELYYQESTNETCSYSTAPSTFSVGMFSWFPLYFPLHQPITVPAHASIRANVWRRVDESRVWYEWSACVHRQGEVLATTPISNPDGRSSFVSL